MDKKKYERIIKLTREASPEVILRAAALCDGHSILKPAAFVEAGLAPEIVEHLTTRHQSDGTRNGTIFVADKAVPELVGVYGLDMLRFLATAMDVRYRQAMGRGFEAANIRAALQQRFAQAGTPRQ